MERFKRLKSDRGGEDETPFGVFFFCEKHGIVHELIPPYSPQSNGVAELKNRTLKGDDECNVDSSWITSKYVG